MGNGPGQSFGVFLCEFLLAHIFIRGSIITFVFAFITWNSNLVPVIVYVRVTVCTNETDRANARTCLFKLIFSFYTSNKFHYLTKVLWLADKAWNRRLQNCNRLLQWHGILQLMCSWVTTHSLCVRSHRVCSKLLWNFLPRSVHEYHMNQLAIVFLSFSDARARVRACIILYVYIMAHVIRKEDSFTDRRRRLKVNVGCRRLWIRWYSAIAVGGCRKRGRALCTLRQVRSRVRGILGHGGLRWLHMYIYIYTHIYIYIYVYV